MEPFVRVTARVYGRLDRVVLEVEQTQLGQGQRTESTAVAMNRQEALDLAKRLISVAGCGE